MAKPLIFASEFSNHLYFEQLWQYHWKKDRELELDRPPSWHLWFDSIAAIPNSRVVSIEITQ